MEYIWMKIAKFIAALAVKWACLRAHRLQFGSLQLLDQATPEIGNNNKKRTCHIIPFDYHRLCKWFHGHHRSGIAWCYKVIYIHAAFVTFPIRSFVLFLFQTKQAQIESSNLWRISKMRCRKIYTIPLYYLLRNLWLHRKLFVQFLETFQSAPINVRLEFHLVPTNENSINHLHGMAQNTSTNLLTSS